MGTVHTEPSTENMLQQLSLLLLLAATGVISRDIRVELLAPPKEMEYGFCSGSPEPMEINKLTAEPFPIELVTGHSVTMAFQATIKEEMPAGSKIKVKLVKEGIIPITIPCLDMGGVFPEHQPCSFPLGPGVYGTGEPVTSVVGEIDPIIGNLLGTMHADISIEDKHGHLWACLRIRMKVV